MTQKTLIDYYKRKKEKGKRKKEKAKRQKEKGNHPPSYEGFLRLALITKRRKLARRRNRVLNLYWYEKESHSLVLCCRVARMGIDGDCGNWHASHRKSL